MNKDPIQSYLSQLPEAPPPTALWNSINSARKAKLSRQKNLRNALAFCAVLAIGLGISLPTLLPTADVQSETSLIAKSSSTPSLSTLDRALQAAYERGASDDEIAPLWTMRNQLAGL